MGAKLSDVLREILRDIRVELADEFDRNFERQGFFNERWQRRRSPSGKGRGILIQTGALRRSIKGKVSGGAVEFESDLPYAALHNEGGEIVVTERMKKYFWYRHITAKGGMTRKKNGDLRNNKANRQLSGEAEFWRRLALMKVGSTIKIPKRQFIGASPELERNVEEIIDEHLNAFFEQLEL